MSTVYHRLSPARQGNNYVTAQSGQDSGAGSTLLIKQFVDVSRVRCSVANKRAAPRLSTRSFEVRGSRSKARRFVVRDSQTRSSRVVGADRVRAPPTRLHIADCNRLTQFVYSLGECGDESGRDGCARDLAILGTN